MIRFLIALCAATTILLLSSCGYWTMSENNENLKKLRVGMTKDQVRQVMGTPLEHEIYHRPDLWWYYTDPRWNDGVMTRDECTPLVFKNDKLAGWGNEFYNTQYRFKDWDKREDGETAPYIGEFREFK